MLLTRGQIPEDPNYTPSFKRGSLWHNPTNSKVFFLQQLLSGKYIAIEVSENLLAWSTPCDTGEEAVKGLKPLINSRLTVERTF